MRLAVWAAASATVLGLALQASADVYSYRDRSGTLVFTNAPAARAAHAGAADARGAPRRAGQAPPAGGSDLLRRPHPRDCRALPCRVCAGEGGDQGGVGLRPARRLTQGCARTDAAHAANGRAAPGGE